MNNGALSLWDNDTEFKSIFSRIASKTLVDQVRCFMLYQFSKQVVSLPGDVCEVGVYKGGTAKLLAKIFSKYNKTLHLFDTFAGMPKTDPTKDLHKKGDFKDTTLAEVKDYLADYNQINFYQGLFPQTAKPIENLSFCFAHIDTDIYSSTMECCEFFYMRMIGGGIILFDDYGFPSCPGSKLAVDEYFVDKRENPIYLPTGQVFVIKL